MNLYIRKAKDAKEIQSNRIKKTHSLALDTNK